jgi:endonuclease/exonuclease/phosphatase family metal-dependent hydrolase
MLTVCTYNVWSANVHVDQRLSSLVEIIENYQPTVICLQEVTDEMYPVLVRSLINDYYSPFDVSLSLQGKNYGEIMFIHKTCRKQNEQHVRFKSSMQNRMIHMVSCIYKNYTFNFINAHFDGAETFPNIRQQQLLELDELAQNTEGISIFALDTNIYRKDNIKNDELKAVVDVYDLCQHLVKDTHHNTYSSKVNTNTHGEYNGEERFDRVYISKRKSPREPKITLQNYELIGTHPIPRFIPEKPQYQGRLFVSDHFGLLVSFEIEQEHYV